MPGSVDPLEIALETVKTGHAPASLAASVLEKQARLFDAEVDRLKRLRWRDYCVMAVALLVLLASAAFVWSASRASGFVAEPFHVPEDFGSRGLGGGVVAAHMLDRLSTLQNETESLRAASTYANDWGDEVEVEVPYTSVSLGELRRVLQRWLGSQTRMSGEVVRLPDGRIALLARVGANAAHRFEGTETEFDSLLQQAAEAIYRETQPYRYSVWLNRLGRADEARALFEDLTLSQAENDRLWGYVGAGNLNPDYTARTRYYRSALALRPGFAPAIVNMAIDAAQFGHEEQAYALYGQALAEAASLRREIEPGRADYILLTAEAARAGVRGDYAGAIAVNRRMLAAAATPYDQALAPLLLAANLARQHDVQGMRRFLADAGLDNEALEERFPEVGWNADPWPLAYAAIGEWSQARDRLLAILAAESRRERDSLENDPTRFVRADLAIAQARSGQIAEARATIAPTPDDCAPCVRARGIIAALAGQPAEADRWFAKAVRQTPSLPAAHAAWAETLLLRGDADGAIEHAREANLKSPKWADPLKTWGDALMRSGKPGDAARRYASAARFAPNWGALRLAWGEALWQLGDRTGAREQSRTAATLLLSRADEARLARMLRQD